MLVFSVVASVHAELDPSSGESSESTENTIVTQLRSLGPPGTEREQKEIANKVTQLDTELGKLGLTIRQLVVAPTNSIKSYFICESDDLLHRLRGHYESGLMKNVLERIFSLLAGKEVKIARLRWTTEEYQKCQQQFSALSS